MPLNLFPSRSAIGMVAANGQQYPVYMTVEFARALADLLERVGGEVGMSVDEISSYIADFDSKPLPQEPEQFQMPAPELAQLMAEMQALRQEVADLRQQVAHTQATSASTADLEQIIANPPQFRVDWERPGTIGSIAPNTASFTFARMGAGTVGLPSLTWASETATGWYRVGANSLGLSVSGTKRLGVDSSGLSVTGVISATSAVFSGTNVAGGGGNFRSYNDTGAVQWIAGILGTAGATSWSVYDAVAGASRITVAAAGGAITMVGNTTVTGTLIVSSDFAGQGICQISGAFGCNTKAPQASATPGPVAIDLATVILRANAIATALSANGICT